MGQPMPEGAPNRRRRIPPWVSFFSLLALALALLLLVCVVIGVLANLLSPTTTNLVAQFLLAVGCQQENPNLPGDTCFNWAERVTGDGSTAQMACGTRLDGTDSARDGVAWYRCMIDQGVDPPR